MIPRKLLWAGIVIWLLLTAGLLYWADNLSAWAAAPSRSEIREEAARQAAEKQLREILADNPALLLDVLRDHSETLLDIVQEGAVLRRNKKLIGDWKADLKTPKTFNLDRRISRGPADAAVTVVAYSDFTCPYCEQAANAVGDLLQKSGDVRYVFKSFPLGDGYGRTAAEYFTAAGLQNPEKAWKFYDLLFKRREALLRDGLPVLKKAAEEAGLDVKRLVADARGKTVRGMVDEDMAEAVRLGVDGTPTLFVNNLVIRGALAPEMFTKAVDMAREAAQGTTDQAD